MSANSLAGKARAELLTNFFTSDVARLIGMLVPAPDTQPPGEPMPYINQPSILPVFTIINIFLHSAYPSACSINTSTSG